MSNFVVGDFLNPPFQILSDLCFTVSKFSAFLKKCRSTFYCLSSMEMENQVCSPKATACSELTLSCVPRETELGLGGHKWRSSDSWRTFTENKRKTFPQGKLGSLNGRYSIGGTLAQMVELSLVRYWAPIAVSIQVGMMQSQDWDVTGCCRPPEMLQEDVVDLDVSRFPCHTKSLQFHGFQSCSALIVKEIHYRDGRRWSNLGVWDDSSHIPQIQLCGFWQITSPLEISVSLFYNMKHVNLEVPFTSDMSWVSPRSRARCTMDRSRTVSNIGFYEEEQWWQTQDTV